MTTFMGQELPPLRVGNVWAMQIFPGGRKVVVQVQPYHVRSVEQAVTALKAGHRQYVSLDDAVAVLQQVKLPTVTVTAPSDETQPQPSPMLGRMGG